MLDTRNLTQAFIDALSVCKQKVMALARLCGVGSPQPLLLTKVIIRDYLMVSWLTPEVSTRDPIISQRALARGLIMVEGLY